MKNPLGGGNGMIPHYSGTTLDAQDRYATGTKSILENYITGRSQEPQNIIVGIGSSFTLVFITTHVNHETTRPICKQGL